MSATSVFAGLGTRLRTSVAEVAGMDVLDLAARMTLIYLLYKPLGPWYIAAPIAILAAWGLLSPAAARSRLLWLTLFLLIGFWVVKLWYIADNHWFLLCYWSLALFCVFSIDSGDSPEALANQRRAMHLNGRLLLGLAFAFATLWKVVLSPDFMDARFMRQAFLLDARFQEFSLLFGGTTQEMWVKNQEAYQRASLADGETSEVVAQFVEPARQVMLAKVATWWTALLEGGIALAFLWPWGRLVSRSRHALLLVFTWTTYPFATVAGFGWLLMVLGVAQCEPERRRTRLLYVATFFIILLFKLVPWAAALIDSAADAAG